MSESTDTHIFDLPIGKYAVTLEDVAIILGLPTDGLPVTGMTMSSFEALEAECLHQFGVAPSVRWKFLPLLRDFGSIGQYSWGSACLAHLYRALCRASRYDCKEIDGPLTLLLGWAWIRLPYLAPLSREPRSFPLANRWHNWERGECRYRYLTLAHFRKALDDLQEGGISHIRWHNWERGDCRYRYLTLVHFRKALDDLQEGHFVWVAYAVNRVDPDIIPPNIYMHSVCWSATVPLVCFECIEWHATDRYRRHFDFVQGVSHQERNLDKAHREVLTGPKNLNWATATTHSFWVMQWTNRYNHVLTELPMPSQYPLDTYKYLYRTKFGCRLYLSNLVVQENDEANQDMDVDNQEQEPQSPLPPPPPPNLLPQEQHISSSQYFDIGEGGSFSQLLGFMAADAGQSQYAQQPDYFISGRYSLDARHSCCTSSDASGGFLSVDSSRSDGGLDGPNSKDEDKEDEIEESDEDEESREAHTPDEASKGYNLRVDPPRRSASRYTPSVFKKAAKKCKKFVKDVKWAMRK
ncbi:uncharacterized protein DS421_20g678960 [Arachis hypogaea]|nr:uncharacterized protein DS421_20g678960 [Arachis hypogaea]